MMVDKLDDHELINRFYDTRKRTQKSGIHDIANVQIAIQELVQRKALVENYFNLKEYYHTILGSNSSSNIILASQTIIYCLDPDEVNRSYKTFDSFLNGRKINSMARSFLITESIEYDLVLGEEVEYYFSTKRAMADNCNKHLPIAQVSILKSRFELKNGQAIDQFNEFMNKIKNAYAAGYLTEVKFELFGR